MHNQNNIIYVPQNLLFIHKNYNSYIHKNYPFNLITYCMWLRSITTTCPNPHEKCTILYMYYVHHYSGWPQSCLRHLVTTPTLLTFVGYTMVESPRFSVHMNPSCYMLHVHISEWLSSRYMYMFGIRTSTIMTPTFPPPLL